MQITFDTTNPQDLELICKFLALAQPAVAQNTGTAGSSQPSTPEVSGVSEPVAATAPPEGESAPAASEKPKRGRKPKAEEPKADEPVVTGQEWEAVAVEPQAGEAQLELPVVEPAPAKPQTIDEVRAALQQFTAAKGVPAGIELLKKFGAGRISELAEDNYASFVAECAA